MEPIIKSFWRTLLLSCLVFSLASCALLKAHSQATRKVTLDGVEMTAEKAAQQVFAQAMDARQDKNDEAAKHLLIQIIKKYDDAEAAKMAYVELGRIFLDHEEPHRAQKILEILLVKHPYAPQANEARYLLALSQLAQGDTEAATPQLDTIVERAGNDVASQAKALQLAQELENNGQYGQAIRYFAQAHLLSENAKEKKALEKHFLEILENSIRFKEMRRLYETERQPPVLREMLSIKMARIHLHLQDNQQGERVIDQYLSEFPQGSFGKEMATLKEGLKKQQMVKAGRIGLLLPMTGPLKVYGARILTAIQMGMGMDIVPWGSGKLIQTKGPITLITLDTKGDPLHALEQIALLVNKYQVIGVIGDPSPETALPIALRAQAYNLPIISLSHRSNLTQLGPYVFRLGLTPEKQADALAEIAMSKMGLRRFAIVYPRHKYGLNMMHAFWNAVQKRQGEITAIEDYGFGQTTFTTEAKKIVGRYFIESRKEYLVCRKDAYEIKNVYRKKKAFERCKDKVPPIVDFDAILIPDQARTVSFVVPALVAEDIPVSQDRRTLQIYRKTTGDVTAQPIQLLGGSTWNNEKLAQRLRKNGEGALFVDGFSTTTARPMVQEFVKSFTEIVGNPPTRLDAQAHDTAKILHYILEGRGTASVADRPSLQEALFSIQDFEGVTGLLSFDEQCESQSELLLFQFAKGMIRPTDVTTLFENNEDG